MSDGKRENANTILQYINRAERYNKPKEGARYANVTERFFCVVCVNFRVRWRFRGCSTVVPQAVRAIPTRCKKNHTCDEKARFVTLVRWRYGSFKETRVLRTRYCLLPRMVTPFFSWIFRNSSISRFTTKKYHDSSKYNCFFFSRFVA